MRTDVLTSEEIKNGILNQQFIDVLSDYYLYPVDVLNHALQYFSHAVVVFSENGEAISFVFFKIILEFKEIVIGLRSTSAKLGSALGRCVKKNIEDLILHIKTGQEKFNCNFLLFARATSVQTQKWIFSNFVDVYPNSKAQDTFFNRKIEELRKRMGWGSPISEEPSFIVRSGAQNYLLYKEEYVNRKIAKLRIFDLYEFYKIDSQKGDRIIFIFRIPN